MHSLTRLFLGVAASAAMSTSAMAADLDPAAVAFTLPDKIEWKQGSGRSAHHAEKLHQAILLPGSEWNRVARARRSRISCRTS